MFKKTLTAFILPFLFLLTSSDAGSANPVAQKQKSLDNQNEANGILQKMIVDSGTATMEFDLNRLNGTGAAPQKGEQVRFDIAARFADLGNGNDCEQSKRQCHSLGHTV